MKLYAEFYQAYKNKTIHSICGSDSYIELDGRLNHTSRILYIQEHIREMANTRDLSLYTIRRGSLLRATTIFTCADIKRLIRDGYTLETD